MVTTKKPYTIIGTRPVRPDGVDKVTGAARYGADVTMPRLLHGRVKRSPYAHARIKSIDYSEALHLEGVKAVVTNADFPAVQAGLEDSGESFGNLKWSIDNLLASDKVLYLGHAVAAVCAVSAHVAEDALDLIEVEYEPLPPVLNVHDAMAETAPLLHERMHTAEMLSRFAPSAQRSEKPSNIASHARFEIGDIDAGFAESDVVVEGEFETGTAHQGYIEPQNGTAFWNKDGQLTVWTSTQGAFPLREQLSKSLNLPLAKIKVVPMEIGGGFGGKISPYLEPLAALLSKKTSRPVKLVMTREGVLTGTGPTSATYVPCQDRRQARWHPQSRGSLSGL